MTRRRQARPADQSIYDFLESGGGSIEMNVDGSSTPVDFSYTLPAAHVGYAELFRLNVLLLAPTVDPADFGAISDGLAEGLQITVRAAGGGMLFDYTRQASIKLNANWGSLSGPVDSVRDVVAGVKPDLWGVRWTFANSGEKLELMPGQAFRITVNDDLSGASDVVQFRCMLQGQLFRSAA